MKNIEWVAGLLEGEGSFLTGPPSQPNLPIIRCSMTDYDVLERLAESLGGLAVVSMRKQQEHHKDAYVVQLKGLRAVVAMRELRPYMGLRRQSQIDRALNSYVLAERGKVTRAERKQIAARFEAGESAHALADEFNVSHWAVYKMRQSKA